MAKYPLVISETEYDEATQWVVDDFWNIYFAGKLGKPKYYIDLLIPMSKKRYTRDSPWEIRGSCISYFVKGYNNAFKEVEKERHMTKAMKIQYARELGFACCQVRFYECVLYCVPQVTKSIGHNVCIGVCMHSGPWFHWGLPGDESQRPGPRCPNWKG